MRLQGVGMGTTASTTTATTTAAATATTTIPNTLTAGLSIWENPVSAFQDIPGVFTLLTSDFSAYGTFAIGALLPIAALVAVLFMSSGGSSSGRKH